MKYQIAAHYIQSQVGLANFSLQFSDCARIKEAFLYKDKFGEYKIVHALVEITDKTRFNRMKLSNIRNVEWLVEVSESSEKFLKMHNLMLIHKIPLVEVDALVQEGIDIIERANLDDGDMDD